MTARKRPDPSPRRAPPGEPHPYVEWHVRCATEADLPGIVDELTGYLDSEGRTKYQRKFARYIRDPDKALIIADTQAGAIGFVCVAEHDDIADGLPLDVRRLLETCATVSSFIVRPEHRRRGVGQSLFARALDWGKARKPAGLWLNTHRTAPWYHQHFGMRELARLDVEGVRRSVMAKIY